MALPAYDQCIKASHAFNLLDARGAISVTERQSYILRVRELAKACGAAWLKTAGGGSGSRTRRGRMNKLDQTKAELREIIEDALGRDLIEEIRVTAQENHAGEPAYSRRHDED